MSARHALPPELEARLARICKAFGDEAEDVIADALDFHLDAIEEAAERDKLAKLLASQHVTDTTTSPPGPAASARAGDPPPRASRRASATARGADQSAEKDA